jgi:hypothetical protein
VSKSWGCGGSGDVYAVHPNSREYLCDCRYRRIRCGESSSGCYGTCDRAVAVVTRCKPKRVAVMTR